MYEYCAQLKRDNSINKQINKHMKYGRKINSVENKIIKQEKNRPVGLGSFTS